MITSSNLSQIDKIQILRRSMERTLDFMQGNFKVSAQFIISDLKLSLELTAPPVKRENTDAVKEGKVSKNNLREHSGT